MNELNGDIYYLFHRNLVNPAGFFFIFSLVKLIEVEKTSPSSASKLLIYRMPEEEKVQ